MPNRLAGRTVFITAVGDLPGDALVRGFAGEGANVAVNHLKPEVAERSASLAGESGVEALALSAHLLVREAVRGAVDSVVARWGKLDILVANATWFLPNDPLTSSDHEWERIVERNLRAQIHAAEAALPHMKAAGYGKVIVMASVAGQMGMPGYTYYCMAKAGEIGYIRALAREFGPAGIRVNGIAPGGVDLFGYDDAQKANIAKQLPVGRTGTVEELAAMTVYLAAAESDFVTGQVFRLDGGLING